MSLAYTRKFIILKKEFSNLGGNPKGHCKLEIKGLRGIVTVNIENAERDQSYNVVFVLSNNNNKIWNLGKIFTDETGKGKGEYVFLQRDLEKENFFLDKISGILVVRDGKVLLGGYLDKEDGTIQRYIDSMPLNSIAGSKEYPIQEVEEAEEIEPIEGIADVQEAMEVQEAEEINEVEEAEEVEKTEEVKKIEEVEDTKEVEDTEEVDTVEEVQKLEVVEDYKAEEVLESEAIEQEYNPIYDVPAKEPDYNPIYDTPAKEPEYKPEYDIPAKEPIEEVVEETVEPVEELAANNEDDFEPDYKTLDYIKKLNQKNQTTNYVLSILRFFPYIEPFKYNLKSYNWWIVELDKENEYRAFLPYFSYIVGGNNKEFYRENAVTCNELMDKYGHYLFGLYNEGENVKYFVYGIPGKFMEEEHPYAGEGGFSTWYEGENEEGYWIIHIDPMTGRPVESPTPMIPID